jgi:hypothetical protein
VPINPRIWQKLHMVNCSACSSDDCSSCAGMAVAPALADGVKFDLPSASKVTSPVHVEMSVQGMTVRPAGMQRPM